MDNRIFNVNGGGQGLLLDTLRLVFSQEGRNTTAKSWLFDKKKGLILLWWKDDKANALPSPLSADACWHFVKEWLASDEAKTCELEGWDAAIDMDGSIHDGWRVYCEDWGHVREFRTAICAILPAKMWHGK